MVSIVRLLAVKFEAMLVVVALVLALTLLENKPLALDFICVALESWTAAIFRLSLFIVALLATTLEPWMLMLSALMFRSPVTLRLLPWCLVLCELE
ncbi:hypothetical protein BSPWISOXPB_7102 [uncultured Gammaproteobacteria bacterium]|nr:hypothetical protein BSPWISOXPB_7102 [uncultured Gammaproteobacteria bacterium]